MLSKTLHFKATVLFPILRQDVVIDIPMTFPYTYPNKNWICGILWRTGPCWTNTISDKRGL